MFIGSDPEGTQRYTGLLQDVRLYRVKLNRSHISELHTQPAKADLRNISGYLRYWQEERQKSFVVEVRDDNEQEGEEVFYLQLVAVQGGARLPDPRPTAVLRVMKSDNANGLFGFTGPCIPNVSLAWTVHTLYCSLLAPPEKTHLASVRRLMQTHGLAHPRSAAYFSSPHAWLHAQRALPF